MAMNPFAGFTPLSSNGNVFLYTPTEPVETGSTTTAHTRDAPSPDLIILSAWMGAAPKHILKYTAAYQSSYPSSTLLVITNDILDIIIFRPDWLQQKRLGPAVEFVHEFTAERKDARVLAHSFSNGGGLQVVQLGKAFNKRYGQPLPVTALALDSSPSTGRDFNEGMNAIMLAFPPSLKHIARPVTFLVMCYFLVLAKVFRQPNAIDHVRQGLLNPDVLGKNVPRVYVYSKDDRIVGYQQVVDHAAASEQAGYWTEQVEIEGSGHVQHMMKDPKRYWKAVADVMKEAEARR